MTVNLSNWISGITKKARELVLEEQVQAAESWRRICEKPTSVTFMTAGGMKLPAQIVRMDSDSRTLVVSGTTGTAPVRQIIIYGIVNHLYLPNTIMKEGYTFIYNKDEYICKDIIETPGEIQGIWEATG